MRTLLSLIGVCLASCVAAPPAPPSFALGELAPGPALESAPGYESRPSSELPSPRSAQQSGTRAARPVWRDQQPLMQGFFGAANYESITREASGPVDIELEDTQLPVLGGGAQVKLGGERIDVGLEACSPWAGARTLRPSPSAVVRRSRSTSICSSSTCTAGRSSAPSSARSCASTPRPGR